MRFPALLKVAAVAQQWGKTNESTTQTRSGERAGGKVQCAAAWKRRPSSCSHAQNTAAFFGPRRRRNAT